MKNIFVLILTVFVLQSTAQIAPNKYYVQFKDKSNSPYSISNPQQFLTQRAINRRIKQGIPIVQNDIPVNPAYLNGVAQTGATLLFPTKWLNGVTISTTSQSVLTAIAALPYVLSIKSMETANFNQLAKNKTYFENEHISELELTKETNEGLIDPFNYGNGYTQINQINGIPLHIAGFRGQGMVIAVLDAGFTGANTHNAFDSLRINNQILGTKDFVNKGGNVYTESNHGHSVLSTMAANRSGQLIGTAPKASYWLLRSESAATEHLIEEYNWVSAAEFADSVGSDIINSSLGYIDFDYPQWNHPYSHMNGNTAVVTIGADIAASKGILVVNSAGNSGSSATFPYIGAPADGFKVFSIGAVDGNGIRASFSSIGPTFDGRIKPDVMARGSGTSLAGSTNTSYTTGSGTSFSSPVIAGMSACLWQAKPNFTNMQIKQAIMQSGDRALNPNNTNGYGIPNFTIANSLLTSIDTGDSSQDKLLGISPNPLASMVNIEFRSSKELTVEAFNSNGRVLFNIRVNPLAGGLLQKKLLELKPGLYLLNVRSNEAMQTIKLIKN